MDNINIEQQALDFPRKQRHHVRTNKSQRESLLNEFDSSGMNAAKFCRMRGLVYPTFAGWIAKRRDKRKGSPIEPERRIENIAFVEASMESQPSSERDSISGVLLVDLPGGASMKINSQNEASLAATLLRALGGLKEC